MKDKEFAEKFGKIISHYVRGMISHDEMVMELVEVIVSENPDDLSHHVIIRATELFKALAREEI